VLEILRKAAAKNGIELVSAPATSSTDVLEAAELLTTTGIDAICQIPDNNTGAAFASIVQAAAKKNMPLFAFGTPQVKLGGLLAVTGDYFDSGRQAALLAARIIRGEDPSKIPMEPITRNKLILNSPVAERLGITFPRSLIEKADEFVEKDGTVTPKKTATLRKLSK
jgi:putative ABC transport system substrate-binding protein